MWGKPCALLRRYEMAQAASLSHDCMTTSLQCINLHLQAFASILLPPQMSWLSKPLICDLAEIDLPLVLECVSHSM